MTNTNHKPMEAHVIGQDSLGIAVEVADRKGYTNHVLFGRDGELIGHVHERFSESTQTDTEPARILKRVQFRARNEAHRQTDADLLVPVFDWQVIEDTIAILDSFDIPQIMDQFWEFYDAIQSPAVDDVAFTALFLSLNDDRDAIIDRSEPLSFYFENKNLVHTDVSFDQMPDVYVTIPPFEKPVACDKRFRDLLIHHLKCRIRDLHYMQGRQPPLEYQVEGLGINKQEIIPFSDQSK